MESGDPKGILNSIIIFNWHKLTSGWRYGQKFHFFDSLIFRSISYQKFSSYKKILDGSVFFVIFVAAARHSNMTFNCKENFL